MPFVLFTRWDGVRVFVPQAQRVKVKRAGAFDRVRADAARRIYPEDLAAPQVASS